MIQDNALSEASFTTLIATVKLLKIRTPEKYTVIIPKFYSYGFFIEKCVQTMQMEWQTV